MIDLDEARSIPENLAVARELFVFWQTKEFYARADRKALKEDYAALQSFNQGRWYPSHAPYGETEEQKIARDHKDNEACRKVSEESRRLDAEEKQKAAPLEWLLAEAQWHRVWFTGWISAYGIADKAVGIECMRAAITEVMREL